MAAAGSEANQDDSAPAGSNPPVTTQRATDAAIDAALLARLQQHDMRALEEFYDRYSRLAYGLAYRILGDATAAEDVVQEAFVNVWRQAPSYDPRRGAVRTWLLSIVHHRAIDVVRSRANRQFDVQIDLVEQRLSVADTWQTVAGNVEREAIRRAVAALPAEQQRTIELAYFGGYSQPEIAAAMGVPLSTVKGRIRMAMHKLRALLQGTEAWASA
ncbi:MAG: sigma-70 family RNA polymerase sigma factor [Chloroflexi bacterium]|nr:sigma-70 family RNA polymerase sigma factor [Chloroflexota bacterium]